MEKIAKFEKVTKEEFMKVHSNIQDYQDIDLPKRATIGSAGYDFFAPFSFTLKQGETLKIPTGIRVKISEGWLLGIFPRSSLGFKYRLQLDNTIGIIDSDYYYATNEGHIFIKVTNDSKEKKIVQVEKGESFAQGIFLPFGITEDDYVVEKRTGGMGSTNKTKKVD